MNYDYYTACCAAVFAGLVTFKAFNQWRQSGRFPIHFGKVGTLQERFSEFFAVSGLFGTLGSMIFFPMLGLTGFLFDPFSPFQSAAWGFFGALLTTAGVILLARAYYDMGKSWRLGIDRETTEKLVTSGIFSLTRNPICIAINLLLVGYFFANPNLFFLVLGSVGLLGTHIQIINEEHFLSQHYGDEFVDYTKRTGRHWTFRFNAKS